MQPPLIIGIREVLRDLLDNGKVPGGAPANFAYHVFGHLPTKTPKEPKIFNLGWYIENKRQRIAFGPEHVLSPADEQNAIIQLIKQFDLQAVLLSCGHIGPSVTM